MKWHFFAFTCQANLNSKRHQQGLDNDDFFLYVTLHCISLEAARVLLNEQSMQADK